MSRRGSGDGDRRPTARAVDHWSRTDRLRFRPSSLPPVSTTARSPNTYSSPLELSKGTSRTPTQQDQSCRGRGSIRLRDSSAPRALGTSRRSGAPGGRESRQAPDSGTPQSRSGRPPQLCERRSAERCESAASVPEWQSRRPPTSASPDASLLTSRRPATWQRAVGRSRTAMRPPRPHALDRLMQAVQ
jgi:hypothetical protein